MENRRTEQFGLVLLPSEKVALERLAEVEGGLSQAALVRRLIRQAAKDQGLWTEGQGQGRAQEVQTTGVARDRAGV